MTRSRGGDNARLALLALIAGALAVALAPVLVRLSEVGPTATALYRLIFAVPLLGLIGGGCAVAGRPVLRRRGLGDVAKMAIPGLIFAGDLAVWHRSIEYTTVANATLLANFAPILVTAAAWLFLGERITRGFIFGLVLAVGGTVVLMSASIKLSGAHLLGDGLGLLTAFFYASYQLSVKRLRARYGALELMTWSSVACALALLPLTLLAGESLLIPSWRALAVLVALGGLVHVFGQGMVVWAFAHLPASFGSVSLLLQPVGAAVLAWLLLGEGLGGLQLLGGGVVLVGLILARKSSSR